MKIFDGLDHLKNVVGCFGLGEAPFIHQLLINFTSCSEFQNEINLLLIPEKAIELADIFMSQVALDLYFSS